MGSLRGIPLIESMSINFPLFLSLFTITAIRGGRLLLPLYALKLNADPFTVGLIAATFSALPMMLSLCESTRKILSILVALKVRSRRKLRKPALS